VRFLSSRTDDEGGYGSGESTSGSTLNDGEDHIPF